MQREHCESKHKYSWILCALVSKQKLIKYGLHSVAHGLQERNLSSSGLFLYTETDGKHRPLVLIVRGWESHSLSFVIHKRNGRY